MYKGLKEAVIFTYNSKLISKISMTMKPYNYSWQLMADKVGVYKIYKIPASTIRPVIATAKSLTLTELGTLPEELIFFMKVQYGPGHQNLLWNLTVLIN